MRKIGALRGVLLGLAIILVSLLMHVAPVSAANPTTISFQGKVVNANGTNVTDGSYSFLFKLYTVSSGGAAVWTETQASVTVTSGVFQVNLGSVCPFFTANVCNGSTPIDFNANPALYLGITFNGDAAGEMTPRVQLQSVPYAYNADKVGGLSNSQLVQLTPAGGQQSGSVNVTSVITPSLTSSGALVINSGAATNVTMDSAGAGTAAINIGGTNATSVGLSRSGQTTAVNGALTVAQNATFNSNVIMTFGGTENLAITSDLAGNVSGISFIGTPSATAGTTNGAFIQQAASANANGLDNGLVIDNADNNTLVGNAIDITNTGGGGYTNYISAPNFILTGTGQIEGKGFNYFDPSTLTQATGATGLNAGGAAGAFGGAFDSGAFIDNDDNYSQEFIGSKAVATTNNQAFGDDGKWYFNNNAQAIVSAQDVSTTGGFARLTSGATTGRGGLLTEGATAGTQDKPLAAANLPIVQMKVRVSTAIVTMDTVFGMMDTATAITTNDPLPTNGIVFWTNNAASSGSTGWQGVIRTGGVTEATVTCPATADVTTGAFAVGRIVVVNTTTVRFFIDPSATGGVNLIDCGTATVTAANMPAVAMAMGIQFTQTVNTTGDTADLDYARYWQDDAAPASPDQAASDVSSEETLADISTGSDDATTADPTTDPAVASDLATTPTDTAPPPGSDAEGLTTTPTADGTTQLTNSSGVSEFSFDSNGNATLSGNLSLANATLSGGLTVGGDVNVGGLSTFQQLATFFAKTVFKKDVEFDGHITVAADTAGYASLRTGESTIHITFTTPYANPPIVTTTVTNGQFGQSSVDNVTDQGFDITMSTAATAPTTFSWTAIGVNNPQIATNPLPSSP